MLETVRQSAQAALRNAGLTANEVAAIGIANQGETVIAFDARDGRPVTSAISWQDRRGEPFAERWQAEGLHDELFRITGLRLDAYFSGPKLAWILQNVPQARMLQRSGQLRYGTSDAWLIWQLTGGRHFVTDVATASRTMLMDLATLNWSPTLSDSFGIPISGLPRILPNASSVGVTSRQAIGDEIPVAGICVDQQAALFGHGALDAGQAKITYGTGCFVLTNIGDVSTRRAPGLLTSVGWRIADNTSFVFDGGVYSAGSLIDWLCKLGLAPDVNAVSQLAAATGEESRVMLIPAFGGLAAPRWASRARACWVGIDHGTNQGDLARSALESIAFCVKEIVEAIGDAGIQLERVDVDGGLSQCDLLMQIQADVLGIPLSRSDLPEYTAVGAGYLAGLGGGLWRSLNELPTPSQEKKMFTPDEAAGRRLRSTFAAWKEVCSRVVAMGDAGLFQVGVK
jgi:glycerol kinase